MQTGLRGTAGVRETVISAREALAVVAIALVLWLAVAWWVPPNLTPDPRFIQLHEASWTDGLRPRALVGTLAGIFGLGLRPLRLLIVNLQVVYVALIVGALVVPVWREGPRARLAALLLAMMFVFNTTVYVGNGYPSALEPLSALLFGTLVVTARRSRGAAWLAGAGLTAFVALLIHEVAIFAALVLGIWFVRLKGRRAAWYFAPFAAGAAAFLVLVRDRATTGLSPAQYLMFLQAPGEVLVRSVNLIGLVLAGGALWIVIALAASAFVKAAPRPLRPRRAILVAALLVPCFAPLLFAWDTNRLVAIVWLPALLLSMEVGLARLVAGHRAGIAAAVMLAALQLALPPWFIYSHRVVALNCYGARVLAAAERAGHVVAGAPILAERCDE